MKKDQSTRYDIPPELEGQVAITPLDKIYNWGRRSSVWPMMFGLACCAIEMIATAASRYDFSRFGMEVMRPSPRQADLMLVSGTVTKKMIPQIVRLYNQMPEPKYVVAMGACASGGGPFKEGYNVVSGVDKYVPVDVYIPGCPPTPQALLHGLITLQKLIDTQSLRTARWYNKDIHEVIPVPVLGPDIIDPRQTDEIKQYTAHKLAEQQQAEAAESVGVGSDGNQEAEGDVSTAAVSEKGQS
jgi:NADH-quinone oxidoreductase subunit B